MLLIVLTALMVNGMMVIHHVTSVTSSPVCEHHIDTHEEFIRDDAKTTTVGVSIPAETKTSLHPQRDRLVSKLLHASIFHPPQAN